MKLINTILLTNLDSTLEEFRLFNSMKVENTLFLLEISKNVLFVSGTGPVENYYLVLILWTKLMTLRFLIKPFLTTEFLSLWLSEETKFNFGLLIKTINLNITTYSLKKDPMMKITQKLLLLITFNIKTITTL